MNKVTHKQCIEPNNQLTKFVFTRETAEKLSRVLKPLCSLANTMWNTSSNIVHVSKNGGAHAFRFPVKPGGIWGNKRFWMEYLNVYYGKSRNKFLWNLSFQWWSPFVERCIQNLVVIAVFLLLSPNCFHLIADLLHIYICLQDTHSEEGCSIGNFICSTLSIMMIESFLLEYHSHRVACNNPPGHTFKSP